MGPWTTGVVLAASTDVAVTLLGVITALVGGLVAMAAGVALVRQREGSAGRDGGLTERLDTADTEVVIGLIREREELLLEELASAGDRATVDERLQAIWGLESLRQRLGDVPRSAEPR